MAKWDTMALSGEHTQREIGMIEDGVIGNPIAGDLISREAAIGYHVAKRREAKRDADKYKADDDMESAADCMLEAVIHSEAADALRALPSAQPTAEVERLRADAVFWRNEADDRGVAHREAEAALTAMTENAKALAISLEWMLSETDTNRGDEPMPDKGGRSWNEINSYWIAHEDAASEALAAHNKLMEG